MADAVSDRARLMPILAEAFGSWKWVFTVLAFGPAVGIWSMQRLRQMPEAARIAGGKR